MGLSASPAGRLRARLLDPTQPVRLYGTTPPRAGSTEQVVHEAAGKLVARVRTLPVDGIVVYDIQDESGRTNTPRPFAFTGTVEPRSYSSLLTQLADLPAINYKCIGTATDDQWQSWLTETARDYGIGFVSIVGRPTSGVRYPLALSQAIGMAAQHWAGFTVGGVVIAERHNAARSESARLLVKGIEGCGYFISQTVYHAGATVRLLTDYLRDCRGAGVEPRRIVLTFAPCGREKTMAFIKWLGVNVPEACESAILSAANPLAKSIEICCDNLREILAQDYVGHIPLGINVESVSINRDEIDATVDLFHALSEVLESHR